MAKTLRTSGDYTIKTGTGASGSNTVFFDSKTTRVVGDLVVDGTRTEVNTSTMSIEDKFIEVNRGNSTADSEDSGIFFNRGTSNHGLLYWDAGDDEFQLGTSTNVPSVTAITNMTLGNLAIAEPAQSDHAATKSYVDATSASTIRIAGDDSSVVSLGGSADTLQLLGGTNISNTTVVGVDSITFNLNQNLTDVNSISVGSSNGDLTLEANGTGNVVINEVLNFSNTTTTPASPRATTQLYHKTAGGGGTGVFFVNSNINSGTEGELISKSKATALAIALG